MIRMPIALLLIFLIGSYSLPLSCQAGAVGGSLSWKTSFFTAEAREILSSAQAIPVNEQDEIVVLLDEGKFTYDNEGLISRRHRLVYRVLSPEGIKGWSTTFATWSPWYQDRPSIRARVIAPDGTIHTLQQDAIIESSMKEESDEMFSDRLMLRAPLPAVKVGAVVEEEIIIRDKVPSFAAGTQYRFFFGRGGTETITPRLIIEAPKALALRFKTKLLPDVTPVRVELNGVQQLIFETPAVKPLQEVETGIPGDLPRWACVVFSAGRSWADVAQAYARLVERNIATPGPSPLVRKIVDGATERDVIAARLLAYVRSEIRYTGVELGESSIVPHPPEETLRLKYGDCKDQAALLIKLLRTAGVPAHMALIRTGDGEDVEPDLPGFGYFNHAIVYVPGTTPLWIDPTDPFSPLGELPQYDQGRRALIASDGTVALVTTPEAASTANRLEQNREIFLSELGMARVVESTRLWGAPAASYRANFDHTVEKEQREMLEQYVASNYKADSLTSFEVSSPQELVGPFSLRVEIPGTKQYLTDETEAVAAMHPAAVLRRLPDVLKDQEGPAAPEPRRSEFLMPEPFTVEIRYRIVPPAGFRAKPLPKDESIKLGPMHYSRNFTLEKNGEVTVLQKLDTGKRRLSATDFNAARDGVRRLLDEEALLVSFEQYGKTLMAGGRVREALNEFRRLAALHPKEALHQMQIARALLEAGLGEAGRKAADKAVALEPGSVAAHRTLAWLLQHDAAGRLRRKGYDRSRAITEYRAAIALDPKDFAARANLAILLEYNADGERYGENSDLDGAIKEYFVLRNDLQRKDLDANLLICLLKRERWQETKETALSLDDEDERNSNYLIAVTAGEGVPTALQDAQRLMTDPAARRKAYETAGEALIKLRRYPESAALLEQAAKGSANAAALTTKSSLIKKVKRWEDLQLDEKQPTTVVQQMSITTITPGPPATLFSLFAKPIRDVLNRDLTAGQARTLQEELAAKFRAKEGELSARAAFEIGLSVMDFRLEGNDLVGYRITMSNKLTGEALGERFIVTREGLGYRVVATSSKMDLAGLEILRRVDEGNLEGARILLNWCRDEVRENQEKDSLPDSPFAVLWDKSDNASADTMRLAAAALLAEYEGVHIIPILQAGREKAAPGARAALDMALMRAYLAGKKYEQLLEFADLLDADHHQSARLLTFRQIALGKLKRWDVLQKLAERQLKEHPDDQDSKRSLAMSFQQRGKFAQAEQLYRDLITEGSRRAGDYNNLAWLGLFHSPVPSESVSFAKQAVSFSGGGDWGRLHTLAAVYAASGKAAEARETILKAMDVSGSPVPISAEWYVLGLIAEQYGEHQAAREAYANMDGNDPAISKLDSSYALMKKRLSQLP